MVEFFVGMEGCAIGQVDHGGATTTAVVRRTIRHSPESLRALAKRYWINRRQWLFDGRPFQILTIVRCTPNRCWEGAH